MLSLSPQQQTRWDGENMDALSEWLQHIGLERYASTFLENGVELDSLPLLIEGDLEKRGVWSGYALALVY
jgi:SAM domain (Sterile alpha motif)